jgi:hypothetical protein
MDDSTPGQQPLDAHQTEEVANVEPVTEQEADRIAAPPNDSSSGNKTSKFHGEPRPPQ